MRRTRSLRSDGFREGRAGKTLPTRMQLAARASGASQGVPTTGRVGGAAGVDFSPGDGRLDVHAKEVVAQPDSTVARSGKNASPSDAQASKTSARDESDSDTSRVDVRRRRIGSEPPPRIRSDGHSPGARPRSDVSNASEHSNASSHQTPRASTPSSELNRRRGSSGGKWRRQVTARRSRLGPHAGSGTPGGISPQAVGSGEPS